MSMRSNRIRLRTSCASGALLIAAALLPATAITVTHAQAQGATPLPPVTVEKPVKQKTAAKPKRRAAPQAAAAATEEPPVVAAPEGDTWEASVVGREKGLSKPLTSTTISGDAIASKAPATNDTATLLRDVPGVSVNTGGGVSSLPIIQGLNDDRIKTLVNGAIISSACANHMNPPLSYTDPTQVKKVQVFTGVTPVAVGGDSIAGSIIVDANAPQFAQAGEGVVTHGSISGFARSNGDGVGAAASASAATRNLSILYTGGWSQSDNYEDGAGDAVPSTEYETQNHALALAARRNGDVYSLEGGWQRIPYQGFVNQAMDMTSNESWYVNGRYEGNFAWGKLDARAFYRDVSHSMDFLDDKVNFKKSAMNPHPTMPMNVEGEDAGYSVKAEIPLSSRDMLRVGNEFHHQGIDEWWPPVAGKYPGMCCNDFVNINEGERNRIGTFAEWERKWTPQWTTLLGVRNDVVWMDTGDVQGYSDKNNNGLITLDYATDSANFNAKDHSKTDVNFDMTAMVRYEPDATHTLEAGYARKTRSPSLYERYTWSTGGMAARMIGWTGDLNGYYGDIDLDPEVANKASFTVGWHDRANKNWEFKVTPYYSYVQDFITAQQVPALQQPVGGGMGPNVKLLQFVNHDAALYGVDMSGRVALGEAPGIGQFGLSGVIGYVHGEDLDANTPLYHMMPWNARFALEHKLGRWSNAIELQMVDDKTRVDGARFEPVTPGYALVNLRTSYEWENLRLDLGVENVFDKEYALPLGGREFDNLLPVPGAGRSFYAGVTAKF